jgi:hypothetical protein
MRRPLALAAATALTLAAGAAVAPAQTEERATASFTPNRAGSNAAARIGATFDGQRILDRVLLRFPAGTRIDTDAAPQCEGTLQEIEARGGPTAGCPANTRAGTGTARAFLGDTNTTIPLRVWNRDGAFLILFVLNQQTGEGLFADHRVTGRTIDIGLDEARRLNARPTQFTLTFTRKGSAREPFIRTPRSCPRSGRQRAEIVTISGSARRTLRANVRCRR